MQVPDPQIPAAWRLFGESRTLLELPRLGLNLASLARQPRGDGAPVRIFPGFGAGDGSTAPLRGYLRLLGWNATGWGLGANRGEVPDLIPRVARLAVEAAERAGKPVRLVGWSLGGYLAREAAREVPHAVAAVVTLGSPIVGGPKYTSVGRFYREQGVDHDEIERWVELREAERPLEVPVTAVYSRSDGVVAWPACIDRHNPHVEHVEVGTTHLGLGFAPEVLKIVAQRLARPVGGPG